MENLKQLILSALLHDIGKFGQRAASPKTRELESELCPTYEGHPSHIHVLHTNEFIEKTLPVPTEFDRSTLAAVSARHHRPFGDSLAEMCLMIADHLSSGMDRIEDQMKDQSYSHIKDRLISIFDEISFDQNLKNTEADDAWKYRFTKIDDSLQQTKDSGKGADEYKCFWTQFEAACKELDNKLPFEMYLGNLCSLLENYLWCIPSSTYKTQPDISLFDHCYTTASLAQALYAYHREVGGMPENNEADKKVNKFILLGGDLSGIQNYIFNINKSYSTGVAKLFRARSFYIQMLTKTVILELLDQLGLYQVAQVMDAGGKFLLLLPNTQKTKEKLAAFELELQQWFYSEFKGLLSLNLCYSSEVSFNDLLIRKGHFSNTLDQFFDSLDLRKYQKFDKVINQDGYSPVFQFDFGEDSDSNCHVCEIKNALDPCSDKFNNEHETNIRICKTCFDQIQFLGKELPRLSNKYFILSNTADDDHQEVALFKNWKIRFSEKIEMKDIKISRQIYNRKDHKDFSFHPIAGHLPVISKEDGEKLDYIRRYYSRSSKEKIEVNAPKTFSQIAEMALEPNLKKEGVKGKAFLGTLKADVDNLGIIFSLGLKDRLSISRFSSLSRMLNNFFSVGLMRIIEENYKNLYVVFSGGDDLFILGPWNELIHFTDDLKKQFDAFVSYNPEITFSAGIAVEKANVPIRHLAERAETLLESSKEYRSEKEAEILTKNAISLFGHTVPWKKFHQLMETGKWLKTAFQEGKFSTALGYRLLHYSEQYQKFFGAGKHKGEFKDIKSGLYLSHMKYDFSRNFKEKDQDSEEFKLLSEISHSDQMEFFQIPLIYGLYHNRTP